LRSGRGAAEEGDERWFTGDQTKLMDTIKKFRLKPHLALIH
jgi:hypothetical protein